MHAVLANAPPREARVDAPLFGAPRGVARSLAFWSMAMMSGGQNRAALDLLNPGAGDSVLEVGCGPGEAMKAALARVGPQGFVAGIDHAPPAARAAARAMHNEVARGRAVVMRADAGDLPFRDYLFDRAFAVNSFAFWPQPARALMEIARVLRPGGRLVITQRGTHPDHATGVAAAQGFERIGQAAKLLAAGGWTLLDERADRDGAKLLAVSVLARRPA